TKLTWDNALLVSPAFASRLGLSNEDIERGGVLFTVTSNGRSVEAPIYCLPGLADNVIVTHFGYGRRRAGRVGNGAGFDAYPLRTSARLWHAPVTLAMTDRRMDLVSPQQASHMEGRPLVRSGTV